MDDKDFMALLSEMECSRTHRPEETKENTLLLGDCLDLLKVVPNESIDLVLTDPPYNISRENGFARLGRSGIDFGEWDKQFDLFGWLNELPRILTPNGSAVIFNDWKNIGEIAKYCESLGLVSKDFLRCVKSNPMPRNIDRRYVPDCECAVWITRAKAKWCFNRSAPTYQRPQYDFGTIANRLHPTQKPVSLMEEIIRIHSNENEIVLDPFMGSGSTCVAAINTGRKYIGFEKEPTYFEIAKKRVDMAMKGERG